MMAAAANSPFLFGKVLWEETRIPLFEQSVAIGGDIDSARFAAAHVGHVLYPTYLAGYLAAHQQGSPRAIALSWCVVLSINHL